LYHQHYIIFTQALSGSYTMQRVGHSWPPHILRCFFRPHYTYSAGRGKGRLMLLGGSQLA
jgi:hypothetical protein